MLLTNNQTCNTQTTIYSTAAAQQQQPYNRLAAHICSPLYSKPTHVLQQATLALRCRAYASQGSALYSKPRWPCSATLAQARATAPAAGAAAAARSNTSALATHQHISSCNGRLAQLRLAALSGTTHSRMAPRPQHNTPPPTLSATSNATDREAASSNPTAASRAAVGRHHFAAARCGVRVVAAGAVAALRAVRPSHTR